MSDLEPPAPGLHAELDWDSDGQPLSRAFGDIYFSRTHGLEETRHVFLKHNQLAERFSALIQPDFYIGETGFGSGLNFLAVWHLWDQCAPPNARLHFITTEKYPLHRTDLVRALALWPELDTYAQALINQYPVFMGEGQHRFNFADGRVRLTLIIGDAAEGLSQLQRGLAEHPSPAIDAWFLDGFAPAKNPQMWSPALFATIARHSKPGTTAATFSAAGIVKQGLRDVGFVVKRVPGFGRKREMVAARIPLANPDIDTETDTNTAKTTSCSDTPWYRVRDYQAPRQRSALVIGGGLAGCHSARALAERGWQVSLLERHPDLAQEGSGNPQGVVYARLSPKQETLAAFNLASLQFALHYYRPYWQQGSELGESCGVIQLADTSEEARFQASLAPLLGNAGALVSAINQDQASELAGVSLATGGLFFPGAGWLNPPALCRALTNHPSIQVLTNTEALTLEQTPSGWRVLTKSESGRAPLVEAAVVIVANARDALAFEQTQHLPLKSIRGQVTHLEASPGSRNLKTVICGDGYIAPARPTASGQWQHCAGASFNLNDTEPRLRAEDHRANLDKLAPLLPALAADWSNLPWQSLEGRVAFRCTSPDYLPLVGPAPVRADFLQDYAPLGKDARRALPLAGSYWPGLYLSLAYGSRGLAYTPLCAELLAAQIAEEPLPLSQSLVTALNPARFLIRDLRRNRIQ